MKFLEGRVVVVILRGMYDCDLEWRLEQERKVAAMCGDEIEIEIEEDAMAATNPQHNKHFCLSDVAQLCPTTPSFDWWENLSNKILDVLSSF